MKQQWVTTSAHVKSSDIVRVTHLSHRTAPFVFHVSQVLLSKKPLQANCPRLLTALDAAASHTVACVVLLTSPSRHLDACISKLLGSVQLCAEPHSTQDRQLSPY
jgi:hypothetical protein